jgi:hypothetical protein
MKKWNLNLLLAPVLAAALPLMACQGSEERNATSVTAKPPPLNAQRKLFITPHGINPGQTNIDEYALLTFTHSGLLEDATIAIIEGQSHFVDAHGVKTNAKVLTVAPKEQTEERTVQLKAASPLAPDAWYWLVIDQNESLSVAGAGQAARWTAHFSLFVESRGGRFRRDSGMTA